MEVRSIGRRVARLEDALDIRRVSHDERQFRETERLVREAQKMAAGKRKPVRGQHSLEMAAAYLLAAGEDRHREVLSGVVREALEREKRINETGVWIAGLKWWDERELFSDWVWQAVELSAAESKSDPRHAALELSVLRAGVGAFREPTPREELGKDGRPLLLIGDIGEEAPEPPEV